MRIKSLVKRESLYSKNFKETIFSHEKISENVSNINDKEIKNITDIIVLMIEQDYHI